MPEPTDAARAIRLRERLLDRFPWLGWYAWAQVRSGAYHRDGGVKP